MFWNSTVFCRSSPLIRSEPDLTLCCGIKTMNGFLVIFTWPAIFLSPQPVRWWPLWSFHISLVNKHLNLNVSFASLECYANGTMTAVAVKVESLLNLIPSMLTLKDQTCKPDISDDRFAHFTFSVNSCGTTRMVSWTTLDWLIWTLKALKGLRWLFLFSFLTTTCYMKMRLACTTTTIKTTKEQPTHHLLILTTGTFSPWYCNLQTYTLSNLLF